MQYIKEFNDIPLEHIKNIQSYLHNSTVPLEPSILYSSVSDEHVVNTDLRQSNYRTFKDPVLFSLCQAIVSHCNGFNDQSSYIMVHDDITHIVYTEGGFFKQHQDFSSIRSNLMMEYTMLVCIHTSDNISGGETKFTLNPSTTYTSTCTTTVGSVLLFRKDLFHEGLSVVSGEKQIISINIWVCDKNLPTFLVKVKFPEEVMEDESSAGSSSTGISSFIISDQQIANTPTCILNGKIRESLIRDGPPVARPRVIEFLVRDWTFHDFSVVYDILIGKYVDSFDTYSENTTAIIDYFGISFENILCSSINEKNLKVKEIGDMERGSALPPLEIRLLEELLRDPETILVRGSHTDKVKKILAKDREEKKIEVSMKALSDDNVLICIDPAVFLSISAIIRSCNLPYVPYKAVFFKGISREGQPSIFQTLWISIGDYDNLLCMRRVNCEFVSDYDQYIFDNSDDIVQEPAPGLEDYFSAEELATGVPCSEEFYELCDIGTSLSSYGLYFSLHGAVSDAEIISNCLTEHIDYCETGPDDRYIDTEVLPSHDDYHPALVAPSRMFHIDSNGKSCFTLEEAEAASRYLLHTSDFKNDLKSRIAGTTFPIVQCGVEQVHQFFCNSFKYGTLNLVKVEGFVKLP